MSRRASRTEMILTAAAFILFTCLVTQCTKDNTGIGIVFERIPIMMNEYGVYDRNADIAGWANPGDTLQVIKCGYGKDYMYFKVKSNRISGYVYVHDPVSFVGTGCRNAKF